MDELRLAHKLDTSSFTILELFNRCTVGHTAEELPFRMLHAECMGRWLSRGNMAHNELQPWWKEHSAESELSLVSIPMVLERADNILHYGGEESLGYFESGAASKRPQLSVL